MSGLIKKNQNWLPSVFNDFFDNDWPVATLPARTTSPAINVCETDKEYVVEVAAPGMTKEDFRVCIDDNDYLVLSLEKRDERKGDKKEGRYLRREFSYTSFRQAIVLPDNVDKEKVEAHMDKGVLCVTLPKREPTEKREAQRMIEVK